MGAKRGRRLLGKAEGGGLNTRSWAGVVQRGAFKERMMRSEAKRL